MLCGAAVGSRCEGLYLSLSLFYSLSAILSTLNTSYLPISCSSVREVCLTYLIAAAPVTSCMVRFSVCICVCVRVSSRECLRAGIGVDM